jgi:hypothetical protein
MDVITVVISSAAGATVRRVLNLKLGDYADPDNLLEGVTTDTVEDLLVTAILSGGRWMISQVMHPSAQLSIDPKLEAEVDAKLRAIQERIAAERQSVAQYNADRLRLFSAVEAQMLQLETILRAKGRAYAASDIAESRPIQFVRIGLLFTVASMRGRVPDLGRKVRSKMCFTTEDERLELSFGWADNRVIIYPTEDGRVEVTTELSVEELGSRACLAALVGTKIHDKVETVMAHVKEVSVLFLDTIERRAM